MQAIEFTTKIKNGVIEIPREYKLLMDKIARVIILTEDKVSDEAPKNKESIQAILEQLGERKAFEDITDPVAWQKSIRDEWS